MTTRRICYLLLLAVGGCSVMLYDFQGLRFLFCCVLGIPLASFLLLIPGVFLCRVELSAGRTAVTRGEAVSFAVTVESRGPFPVPGILVNMCFRAPGEKALRDRKCLRGLWRGHREEISLEMTASHCGRTQIEVTKAVFFDYLGIFSLSMRKKRELQICVLPVMTPIARGTLDTSVWNLGGMNGEKEGDLFLRDFQPGDTLHRVYWKLSAKDGELQVRDFEQRGIIRLNLNFSEDFRAQAEKWDEYLDRACSLLLFFSEYSRQNGQTVSEVVWRQGNGFWRYDVAGLEALQAWITALLMGEQTGEPLEEGIPAFSESGFRLEEDGRLYFGEHCIYEG